MKRNLLFSIFIVIFILVFSTSAFAVSNIKVNINGSSLSFDNPPVIQNNTVLVPMRAIFEALGADVTWDSASKTITGTNGQTTIFLTINSSKALKDGEVIELSVPAKSINNSTMVPLRFISESFDCDVTWDKLIQTVSITTTDGTESSSTQTEEEISADNLTDIPVKVKSVKLYRYVDDAAILTKTNELAKNIDKEFGVELSLNHETINKEAYKPLTVNITTNNGVVEIDRQEFNILISSGVTSSSDTIMVSMDKLIKYNEDINDYRINILDGDTVLYTASLKLFYDSTEDEEFVKLMTVESFKFFGNITKDWIDYGSRTYFTSFNGRYQALGIEIIVSYPELATEKTLPVTFIFYAPGGHKQTLTHDYYLSGSAAMFDSMLYWQYSNQCFSSGNYKVEAYIYDTLIGSGNFTVNKTMRTP